MNELFERLRAEVSTLQRKDGLSPSDLLALPLSVANLIGEITRKKGLSLTEIAVALNQDPDDIQTLLKELLEKGYLRQVRIEQEERYNVNFGRKVDKTPEHRTKGSDLLDKLMGQKGKSK